MLFLVTMLLTSGRMETIDFDVQRTGRKLVVDGGITNTNGLIPSEAEQDLLPGKGV